MYSKRTYEGATATVYTPEGEQLCRSIVREHDASRQHITLDSTPAKIELNELYTVLIMYNNTPHEYSSRVAKSGTGFVFMLFKGRQKEGRQHTRYAVNADAYIDLLFRDDEYYELLEHLPVNVVDISKSGMRFIAPINTLLKDDRFSLQIKLGDEVKLFDAIVANVRKKEHEEEYGCRLIINNKKRQLQDIKQLQP